MSKQHPPAKIVQPNIPTPMRASPGMPPQRNGKTLASFVRFCENEGRQLRFWQALMAWSGCNVRVVGKVDKHEAFTPSDTDNLHRLTRDPFNWEGRVEDRE